MSAEEINEGGEVAADDDKEEFREPLDEWDREREAALKE
jgi:hypothetical protein